MNQPAYDAIAHEWAAARRSSFVSKLVADFADQTLRRGTKVLDIGCGPGFLAKFLTEHGLEVTGIDFSAKMIYLAQNLLLREAQFIQSDFFEYSSTQTFNGIIAWDVFFHFPKYQQAEIYPKLYGLLNRGGYLLFTHGNANDEHLDTMFGEQFYYSCLPLAKVKQLLLESGFAIEYILTDYIEKDSHRSLVVLAQKP